jgi:hypothetical protein
MPVDEKDPFDTGRERCMDCKKDAPETESNFTLISQQHGWRLSRSKSSTGRNIHAWRCPECYGKFKARRTLG